VETKHLYRFASVFSQPNCPHVASHRIELQQPTLPTSFHKVNGCELPGGSILRVEPSDPYHKVAAKTWKANPQIEQQSQSQLMAAAMGSDKNTSDGGRTEVIRDGTTGSTLETKLEDSGGGVASEEEEEDLDDFFSSLE
jgi:hypothetical protein